MAGLITLHNIDEMTSADKLAAAFTSPAGRALCADAATFMRSIEEHTTTNPAQQRALAYAYLALLGSVGSLADTAG